MVDMLSYPKLITEHSICNKVHGTPQIYTIIMWHSKKGINLTSNQNSLTHTHAKKAGKFVFCNNPNAMYGL